jgi:hypothetical protein
MVLIMIQIKYSTQEERSKIMTEQQLLGNILRRDVSKQYLEFDDNKAKMQIKSAVVSDGLLQSLKTAALEDIAKLSESKDIIPKILNLLSYLVNKNG